MVQQTIQALIKQMELQLDCRVIVLAASQLEMELLPQLKNILLQLGYVEHLAVVIHTRGGEINAARRIAILLRAYCKRLTFIVPYHCQSAGTLITLAADQIIAGDLALFSPIDPHLQSGQDDGTDMSALDIIQFPEMCQHWFNLEQQQVELEAASLLTQSIFPPTVTAFYRVMKQLQQIALELIQFQLGHIPQELRQNIVNKLSMGYGSHDYAITANELAEMGLIMTEDNKINDIAWQLSLILQSLVGRALAEGHNGQWQDVLLSTTESTIVRTSSDPQLMPAWRELN